MIIFPTWRARSGADKWTCTVRPLHYAQCIAPWKSWPSSSRARNLADCAKLSARIGKSRVAFERTDRSLDNDEMASRHARAHPRKDSERERRVKSSPRGGEKLTRACRALFRRAGDIPLFIGGERRVHARVLPFRVSIVTVSRGRVIPDRPAMYRDGCYDERSAVKPAFSHMARLNILILTEKLHLCAIVL